MQEGRASYSTVAISVLLLAQVHLDRLVLQQFPQLAIEEVVHEVVVARVEPHAVVDIKVVPFRAAAREGHPSVGNLQIDTRASVLPLHSQRPLTHLMGLESQICLFGGCLLTTYVPFSPSLTVKTPDLPHVETLQSVSAYAGRRRSARRETHRVLDVDSRELDLFKLLLEVFGEAVHGRV